MIYIGDTEDTELSNMIFYQAEKFYMFARIQSNPIAGFNGGRVYDNGFFDSYYSLSCPNYVKPKTQKKLKINDISFINLNNYLLTNLLNGI